MFDERRATTRIADLLKRAWRTLARLDVACILIAAVLLLAGLGSCFPQQQPEVAADPERLASWWEGLRARYGALVGLLASAGFFRFFQSPLFQLCLAALGAVTLVCTLNRWRGTWRRAWSRGVFCPDSAFEAAEQTAALVTAEGSDSLRLLAERLEGRGFRVRRMESGEHARLRADRNRLAALATLVTHLGLVLCLLGAASSGLFAWRETLRLEAGAPAAIPHLEGVSLQLEDFSIERYADGSAAAFTAQVRLEGPGREPQRRTIRINEPLKYRGVSIYLQGFELGGAGEAVTLLVVHDPGYGLVVLAGLLLLAGMTVSFNFPHCCVFARLEPEGVLHLAGSAGRRAYDFEREFGDLAAALGRDAGETPRLGEAPE